MYSKNAQFHPFQLFQKQYWFNTSIIQNNLNEMNVTNAELLTVVSVRSLKVIWNEKAEKCSSDKVLLALTKFYTSLNCIPVAGDRLWK